MFEKKKKNKAHKPKRPTWPLKPTSSHYPLYSHHTRSLLKGALMKFTWELALLVDCMLLLNTFFCRITLDYFSNGALNERSVDSNWRVVAAKEHYYYFLVFFLVFSLVFSLELFSLVFFFLSHDWLSLLLGLGAMFSV
jgi:hypothetical protein